MKTLKTKYGAMRIYETKDEVNALTYDDCVNWLEFNDRNGCYSIEDQQAEFGESMSLAEMQDLVLEQSKG